MEKKPYATARTVDDFETGAGQERKPLVGFLTTRVMISEREPLFASKEGMTPGQLIDARINKMNDEWASYPPEMQRPELHAITFEFPGEL